MGRTASIMTDNNPHRAWAFTLHVQDETTGDYKDCADDLYELARSIPMFTALDGWISGEAGHRMKFIYWQEEISPTTGRCHFQGGFNLKKPMRFTGLKSWLTDMGLEGMSFEPCHDAEGRYNREYCRKKESAVPGTQMEFGIQPWDKWKIEHEHLVICLKAGMSGSDLAKKYPDAHLRYGRNYELTHAAITRADSMAKPKRQGVSVHVRWGISGAGKTRGIKVHHGAENIYTWNYEEKFQSYKGQPVLLFDDFDGTQLKINYMKLLLQFEDCEVPSKGEKAVMANWSTVYITSQHTPDSYYFKENHADIAAFMRRISSVTEFKVPYGAPEWEAARGAQSSPSNH